MREYHGVQYSQEGYLPGNCGDEFPNFNEHDSELLLPRWKRAMTTAIKDRWPDAIIDGYEVWLLASDTATVKQHDDVTETLLEFRETTYEHTVTAAHDADELTTI